MFGDEVGALVLDVGSTVARCGFAGDDTPKAVFPSAVGWVPNANAENNNNVGAAPMAVGEDDTTDAPPANPPSNKQWFAGSTKVNAHREHQQIAHAVKHGLVDDWEAYEQILNYSFKEHMRIDSTEHPLMIAEAAYNTPDRRERTLELAFERFQVPAVFLCKDAVLAAFSVGKSSALVLDIGGGKTSAVPVLDGYVLNKGLKHTKVSAATIDALLEQAVFTDKNRELVPRYCLKRQVKNDGTIKATPVDLKNTSPSYHALMKQFFLEDLKSVVCRISETNFDPRLHANIPQVQYELPDGKVIEVGTERFSVPEELFRPTSKLLSFVGTDFEVHRTDGAQQQRQFNVFTGLPDMVYQSVDAVDVDMKKELFGNIVVTGGGSLIQNINSRLQGQLSLQVSSAAKVKIHNDKSVNAERAFGVWTGGSILGSLGSFHQMWFSKAEYQESGDRLALLLAQKFP